jgi:hypothetical protein
VIKEITTKRFYWQHKGVVTLFSHLEEEKAGRVEILYQLFSF